MLLLLHTCFILSSTKHKIFLIFCAFWNRLLLFAVPAIPYNYIINLFYNNVKKKRKKLSNIWYFYFMLKISNRIKLSNIWYFRHFYFYAVYRRKMSFFVKISNCIKRFYYYIFQHFWKSAKNCKYQIFDILEKIFYLEFFQKQKYLI